MKNAVTPSTAKPKITKWRKDAIGYMLCDSDNPAMGQRKTSILSSAYGNGNGFYITADNLIKASIMFSVRRATKHTWLNDKDQFYVPSETPSHEFENDCLIYMLFSNSNLSASADLEWDGKKWEVVNHFIPFEEGQVESNDRFRSNFMHNFLGTRGEMSEEAKAVLLEAQALWTAYFSNKDDFATCKQLCLTHADVGWYQVKNALKIRNMKGYGVHTNFNTFESAYKKLEQKLQPQFLELGFLK